MLIGRKGTNQYIYGDGRIAQANTTTQYLLDDALGSVRQVTNPNGNVVLAKAYDPYGVSNLSSGTAESSYGFTGEYTEPTGDIYLRARHYSCHLIAGITQVEIQSIMLILVAILPKARLLMRIKSYNA